MSVERDRRMRQLFNLIPDGIERIRASQGGVCGVCGDTEASTTRSLAVDHDHRCCPKVGRSCGQCVRGLVCGGCNGLLGLYERRQLPTIEGGQLEAMNAYLRRHAAPERPAVPGRAGRRVEHPHRGEEVVIEYDPQWVPEQGVRQAHDNWPLPAPRTPRSR